MRIGLDLDGTVVEGKYLTRPINPLDYMGLHPYDSYTKGVFNKLCKDKDHDVYIITARDFVGARRLSERWLVENGFEKPAGIITGIFGPEKLQLAQDMKLSVIYDDDPRIYSYYISEQLDQSALELRFMNNPYWPLNQELNPQIKSWKEIYQQFYPNATINN